MLAIVSAKPTASCSARADPAYTGSASSVTDAENCAEPAITDAPRPSSTPTSPAVDAEYASGLARQHAALTSIAALVVAVRPTLSAAPPASTAPDRPATPTAANTTTPVSRRAGSAPAIP